jgi:hypothetical protein
MNARFRDKRSSFAMTSRALRLRQRIRTFSDSLYARARVNVNLELSRSGNGHIERVESGFRELSATKVPPCFIIVCQNTAISKLVPRHVQGSGSAGQSLIAAPTGKQIG